MRTASIISKRIGLSQNNQVPSEDYVGFCYTFYIIGGLAYGGGELCAVGETLPS